MFVHNLTNIIPTTFNYQSFPWDDGIEKGLLFTKSYIISYTTRLYNYCIEVYGSSRMGGNAVTEGDWATKRSKKEKQISFVHKWYFTYPL